MSTTSASRPEGPSTRSKRPPVTSLEEPPARRRARLPVRMLEPQAQTQPRAQQQPQEPCIDLTSTSEEAEDDEPVLLASKPSQVPPPPPSWESSPKKPRRSRHSGPECGICLEPAKALACGPCGHVFCEGCLKAAVKAQKRCPTCRKGMHSKHIHRVYLPSAAS